MTYKKLIKGFQATTLMGEPLSAEDNGIKREGSNAIEAFEAHKIVKAYTADLETGNDIKTLIPFHAIKLAEYVTITENAEKADAYCGGTDGKTYTIVWGDTGETTANIKVGDMVTPPPVPPCEGGSPLFPDMWHIGTEEFNVKFEFTQSMANKADDSGVIKAGVVCH